MILNQTFANFFFFKEMKSRPELWWPEFHTSKKQVILGFRIPYDGVTRITKQFPKLPVKRISYRLHVIHTHTRGKRTVNHRRARPAGQQRTTMDVTHAH